MPSAEEWIMSPEVGFLQDVIAHPDDDTVRLIFADWLEEHGDPRGEFIRLQCESARMAAADARRLIWQQRERWLEAEHPEWVGPELRELALSWTFRRGFVEKVTVSASVYLEKAARLSRLAPITSVMLDLTGVEIPQAIIELVPESVAREHVILPLAQRDRVLTFAAQNSDDRKLFEKMEFILNKTINLLPAPAEQIVEAIDRYYGNRDTESVECVLYALAEVAREPVAYHPSDQRQRPQR
jgi:uncharacterized protein (TIGR02996 family)